MEVKRPCQMEPRLWIESTFNTDTKPGQRGLAQKTFYCIDSLSGEC